MTTNEDPFLRRLADANPVPAEDTQGKSATYAADVLLRRIMSSGPEAPVTSRRSSRRRLIAALTGTVLGLLALILVVRAAGDHPATAAELLRDASVVAASSPDLAPQGEYLYSKTVSEQLTTSGTQREPWSVVLPITVQAWVAQDGSGRHRSEIGDPVFLGPRDRDRWRLAGSLPFGAGVSDETFPAGTLPYEDVRALSTDPAELRVQLLAQIEGEELPSEVGLFLRVAELLAHADATPELRSALFELASQLQNVELLGEATDPLGRTGVAVGMTYSATGTMLRAVVIFDESTSELLAQERILLERAAWVDAKPGTRLSFVAYLAAGRTDSVSRAS